MSSLAVLGRRNFLANAASTFLAFVTQLITAFYLARLLIIGLGDERYGVWSLVQSVLAYLMVLDLGVGASVVRYIAKFETVRDDRQRNQVFSTSMVIFAAAGTLALVIALSLAVTLAWVFRIPAELVTETRWVLALMGANVAVGLPLKVFAAVLDGLGRYPASNSIRIVMRLLSVVLIVAALSYGGGLLALALVTTAINLFEHLGMAALAWHYLPTLRFSPRLVNRQALQLVRGYSIRAFLIMIAHRISFQTDAFVIAALLGSKYITFFAIGASLVEYAKGPLASVLTVLTPTISALEAKDDHGAIRRIFIDGSRYALWLILPASIGLIIFGQPFLSLWLDAEHARLSYPTLVILAIPLWLAMSQVVSVRILYGLGELRWLSRAAILQALANFLLSIALAGPYGIEGVAWGTTIPNLIYSSAVAIYVSRALGVRLGGYLGRAFQKPLIGGLALAVGWSAAVVLLSPMTWLSLWLVGGAGLGCYAALAALMELGPRRLRELGRDGRLAGRSAEPGSDRPRPEVDGRLPSSGAPLPRLDPLNPVAAPRPPAVADRP